MTFGGSHGFCTPGGDAAAAHPGASLLEGCSIISVVLQRLLGYSVEIGLVVGYGYHTTTCTRLLVFGTQQHVTLHLMKRLHARGVLLARMTTANTTPERCYDQNAVCAAAA